MAFNTVQLSLVAFLAFGTNALPPYIVKRQLDTTLSAHESLILGSFSNESISEDSFYYTQGKSVGWHIYFDNMMTDHMARRTSCGHQPQPGTVDRRPMERGWFRCQTGRLQCVPQLSAGQQFECDLAKRQHIRTGASRGCSPRRSRHWLP
jgi:hypothetical protein